MSVLGLIIYISPYMRSAMVRFPLESENRETAPSLSSGRCILDLFDWYRVILLFGVNSLEYLSLSLCKSNDGNKT